MPASPIAKTLAARIEPAGSARGFPGGRRRLLLAMPAVAALGLAGCDFRRKAAFRNTDITGASFGKDFALIDHEGRPRTLADYRGKVVTLFFGYTHCPDVCPATLVEMAQVMKLLGSKSDRVQVLFVTVDPERDTQELLASYVPAFDKRFVGLYGDAEATAKAAKEFRVFYQKVVPSGAAPGIYTIDHSAGSFAFDAQGRVRLFITPGQGPESRAQDLGRLIDEG